MRNRQRLEQIDEKFSLEENVHIDSNVFTLKNEKEKRYSKSLERGQNSKAGKNNLFKNRLSPLNSDLEAQPDKNLSGGVNSPTSSLPHRRKQSLALSQNQYLNMNMQSAEILMLKKNKQLKRRGQQIRGIKGVRSPGSHHQQNKTVAYITNAALGNSILNTSGNNLNKSSNKGSQRYLQFDEDEEDEEYNPHDYEGGAILNLGDSYKKQKDFQSKSFHNQNHKSPSQQELSMPGVALKLQSNINQNEYILNDISRDDGYYTYDGRPLNLKEQTLSPQILQQEIEQDLEKKFVVVEIIQNQAEEKVGLDQTDDNLDRESQNQNNLQSENISSRNFGTVQEQMQSNRLNEGSNSTPMPQPISQLRQQNTISKKYAGNLDEEDIKFDSVRDYSERDKNQVSENNLHQHGKEESKTCNQDQNMEIEQTYDHSYIQLSQQEIAVSNLQSNSKLVQRYQTNQPQVNTSPKYQAQLTQLQQNQVQLQGYLNNEEDESLILQDFQNPSLNYIYPNKDTTNNHDFPELEGTFSNQNIPLLSQLDQESIAAILSEGQIQLMSDRFEYTNNQLGALENLVNMEGSQIMDENQDQSVEMGDLQQQPLYIYKAKQYPNEQLNSSEEEQVVKEMRQKVNNAFPRDKNFDQDDHYKMQQRQNVQQFLIQDYGEEEESKDQNNQEYDHPSQDYGLELQEYVGSQEYHLEQEIIEEGDEENDDEDGDVASQIQMSRYTQGSQDNEIVYGQQVYLNSQRIQEQEYEAYQYYLQQHHNQLSLIQEDNTLEEGGGVDEDYGQDNCQDERQFQGTGCLGLQSDLDLIDGEAENDYSQLEYQPVSERQNSQIDYKRSSHEMEGSDGIQDDESRMSGSMSASSYIGSKIDSNLAQMKQFNSHSQNESLVMANSNSQFQSYHSRDNSFCHDLNQQNLQVNLNNYYMTVNKGSQPQIDNMMNRQFLNMPLQQRQNQGLISAQQYSIGPKKFLGNLNNTQF